MMIVGTLEDGRRVMRTHGGTVTETSKEMAERLAEARKRQIADAAPELLDALENLLIAVGMGWDLEGVVTAARTAVAKATAEKKD